jgi:hypothetical protein
MSLSGFWITCERGYTIPLFGRFWHRPHEPHLLSPFARKSRSRTTVQSAGTPLTIELAWLLVSRQLPSTQKDWHVGQCKRAFCELSDHRSVPFR